MQLIQSNVTVCSTAVELESSNQEISFLNPTGYCAFFLSYLLCLYLKVVCPLTGPLKPWAAQCSLKCTFALLRC